MIITLNNLVVLLVLLVVNSASLYHRNGTYIDILSRSAIKVIESVNSECFLKYISITTSNSRESTRQHNDIIRDIVDGVANGMSIISTDDGTSHIGHLKERTCLNILVLDGPNGVRTIINQILNGTLKGKFLVVVNNVTADYINLVNEISGLFFYNYAVNFNLLITNPTSHDQVFMFTCYPYKPQQCSRCNLELYNIFENETFLYEKPHFPNKLQNFYNCTIVVATFNTIPFMIVAKDKNGKQTMSGFEGDLFNKMAEILNFNVKLIISPEKWGVVNPNNASTGAYGLVQNNTANVTLGSFFFRQTTDYFDTTFSYDSSMLCIYIPLGRPFTSIEKTMWPFRKEVWYTMLFVAALKILIQIPIKSLPLNRHFDHIDILDFARIYLGFSIVKYPVKLLSKMFVIGMFFYALILRTCYQSSLFHFMTLKVNGSTDLSVNDLVKENFSFHLLDSLYFALETLPEVKSRAVIISNYDEFKGLTNVSLNWESKKGLISTRTHSLNFPQMIASKENIYQLSIAMVLRKNSYLTEVFNEVIFKLLANGYLSKLHSNLKTQVHKSITSSELLSVNDVVGLFRICLCGYCLAVVVFGSEIVSHFLQNRPKKKITKSS